MAATSCFHTTINNGCSQKRDDATPADSLISRRLALTVLIGAAAVDTKVSLADAAYGEAANVFRKQKSTEFTQYVGLRFKLAIPAKWNPSKEVEYPGQVLRYEDNFDFCCRSGKKKLNRNMVVFLGKKRPLKRVS